MALRTGLDRFLASVPGELHGARVGLLTHAAGTDDRGRSGVDCLVALADLRVVRLFAPEHGVRGERPGGEPIADGVDPISGIEVCSLYGPRGRGVDGDVLEAGIFAGLDAVLVDLQDIGARYFTYPGTMRRLLVAAARAGVPVHVLDRPNPLGGLVAGPATRASGLGSLVCAFDVPLRHGLTMGELALLAARDDGLPEGAVRVWPVQGWRRSQDFAAWDRPWVPPSPNSTGPDMAELYVGMCVFEGSNVSEGRGTPYPFRQIGAPWWDGPALVDGLTASLPTGLRARSTWFLPTASKHAGLVCQGVAFDLEPHNARPADAALMAAAHLLCHVVPDPSFQWRVRNGVYGVDRLTGGDALRNAVTSGAGAVRALLLAWRAEADAFARARPVDLYPERGR